jgi:hypothetical protein
LLAPSQTRDHLVLYSALIQPSFLLKFDDLYGLYKSSLYIEQTAFDIDPPDLILQTLTYICRAEAKKRSRPANRIKRKALAGITDERGNPLADIGDVEPQAKRCKYMES